MNTINPGYFKERDKVISKYAKRELVTDIASSGIAASGLIYTLSEILFDMPNIIYEKSDGPEILLGITAFAVAYLGGGLINNKIKEKQKQKISHLESIPFEITNPEKVVFK
jgi:hypothetical protein